jgi:general secretion pathway protein C
MPRITMITIQFLLLVGIASLSVAIVRKEFRTDDLRIEKPTADQPEQVGKTLSFRKQSYASYRSIEQRNLFQLSPDSTTEQTEIDLSALKPTELKLKLWGTITGPDVVKRAVVEDTTQRRQVILREKEEIAAAKIKMILRDKVILTVAGEDQILEMEKPASNQTNSSAISRISPLPRQAPSVTQETLPTKEPGQPVQIPAMRIRIRPEVWDQLTESPDGWDQFAAVSSHQDDAGSNGLLFTRITPSSPLRRLGIRNGDILLDINGEPIGSLKDMANLFQNAASDEEMTIQLKRRGRIREMTFVFE